MYHILFLFSRAICHSSLQINLWHRRLMDSSLGRLIQPITARRDCLDNRPQIQRPVCEKRTLRAPAKMCIWKMVNSRLWSSWRSVLLNLVKHGHQPDYRLDDRFVGVNHQHSQSEMIYSGAIRTGPTQSPRPYSFFFWLGSILQASSPEYIFLDGKTQNLLEHFNMVPPSELKSFKKNWATMAKCKNKMNNLYKASDSN